MLFFPIVGLVGAHLVVFHILRHANAAHALIPGALISGVFILALVKHMGLLAVLFRRLRSAASVDLDSCRI
jgi:hypothetical protein